MIGCGDIQVGILGVLLIGGHHLDMIDGDMESTTVGIITGGDTITTTVGTITMDRVGEEVMLLIHTEEEDIHQQQTHQAVL